MYELDFKKHKDLIDKCLKGKVSLFTGAGFSLGATVKDSDISTTYDLIDSLLTELLELTDADMIKRLKKKSFQGICQYCIGQVTEDRFNEFIVEKFKDTVPTPFHYNYTQINWKEIYSTNVDDIIESIYRRNSTRLQVLNTKKQTNDYSGTNVLKYYKLHGDVNNKSEGFIFAKNQYLEPLVDENYSYPHIKFAEHLYSDTFCFIGSSFDEIDIDKYMYRYRKGNNATLPKNKIYYISKNIYPEDIEEKESKNIICIQETAESFITKLLKYKDDKKKSLIIVDKKDPTKDMDEIGFSYINRYLLDNIDDKKIKKHKPVMFYTGYNAQWVDVASGSDAILHNTQEVIDLVSTENKFQLFTLVGKSGNGKSTALKRILYTFAINSDYIVFEHKNFQELSLKTVNRFISFIDKQKKKIIIGFDDGAWALRFINDIYSKVDTGIDITFVVTSRYPEFYREKRFMTGVPNNVRYVDDTITKENAKKIINVLENKGYLGNLASFPSMDDKIKSILSLSGRDKDLFSCLISATKGKGFFERINGSLDLTMEQKNIKMIFLSMLAIFDRFATLPLSISLFHNVFMNEIQDIQEILNEISDFLSKKSTNLSEQGISTNVRPRGAYVTEYIMSNIDNYLKHEEVLKVISKILVFVASTYNISKKERNNYYTELVNVLLNSRNYMNHLGIRNKRHFDDFYSSIKNAYGDHSLFWLNYARMEMKLNDLESAWIHLQQAKALTYNSYQIEHAIGQWYLLNAKKFEDINLARDEFTKGEEIMIRQIKLKRDAYPIHTYVVEFMSFYSKFKQDIDIKKAKKLIGYIDDAKKAFPEHILVFIIWKKFYNFLKKNNCSNIMKLTLDDLKLMEKVDINKSAEEQYEILQYIKK